MGALLPAYFRPVRRTGRYRQRLRGPSRSGRGPGAAREAMPGAGIGARRARVRTAADSRG